MPPSSICRSVGLWTRPQGRQPGPVGAWTQASFQHNFGKLQTRIRDCYLFISSPRHFHRDDGCPCCIDVNAALASSSISDGCRACMDLLPRHFSLFQFRVGSWFIANSVLLPRWQGNVGSLTAARTTKDNHRYRQSERWGSEECYSEIINTLPLCIIWLVPPADYEILRNSL